MSQTSTQSNHSGPPATAAGADPVSSVRVDAAHPLPHRASEPTGETDVPDVSELDRRQLAQLAQRLHDRHRELCRQQEELNAEFAALDRERRKERLRLQEQQRTLEDQETRLAEMAAELTRTVHALEKQREEQRRHEADLQAELEREAQEARAAREQAEQQKRAWDAEKRRLEQRVASLEQQLCDERSKRNESENLWQERHSRTVAENRQRLQRLSAIERTLAEQAENVERERERHRRYREAWESRLRQRRIDWVEKWSGERRKLLAWKQRLGERAEELESRRAALEQLEADLHDYQTDVLKQRLALEAAESRLRKGTVSPQQTQLIAALRAQLDAELQWSLQQRQQQEQELLELLERIENRSLELADRRQSLVQWLRKREAEQAERARQLRRKEEDLQAQMDELRRDLEAMETRCLRAEAQLRTWVSREYHAA